MLADNGANASVRTPRGGIVIRANDFNPERVIVDDDRGHAGCQHRGALHRGTSSACSTKPSATSSPAHDERATGVPSGIAREATDVPADQEIAVATFNVENLAPSDPSSKFAWLADIVVDNLGSPDIVSIEEVQDNNWRGPITASRGPTQRWSMLIVGDPGGRRARSTSTARSTRSTTQTAECPAATSASASSTDRPGREFIDRPGGGPTVATTVIDHPSGPRLSSSLGRVAPNDPAWSTPEGVRKPLVGEFRAKGKKLFVIANHWKSKSGDDPLFGRFQPPKLVTEPQRTAEAAVVKDFVDILAADPFANVIVLGDLNDFEFSAPLTALEGGEPPTR